MWEPDMTEVGKPVEPIDRTESGAWLDHYLVYGHWPSSGSLLPTLDAACTSLGLDRTQAHERRSLTTIVVRHECFELVVEAEKKRKGGDAASRAIGSGARWVRRIETSAEEERDRVAELISACNLLMSCHGTKGAFDWIIAREYLKLITKGVDGLIFDGWGFLDAHGTLRISGDGESGLASLFSPGIQGLP